MILLTMILRPSGVAALVSVRPTATPTTPAPFPNLGKELVSFSNAWKGDVRRISR